LNFKIGSEYEELRFRAPHRWASVAVLLRLTEISIQQCSTIATMKQSDSNAVRDLSSSALSTKELAFKLEFNLGLWLVHASIDAHGSHRLPSEYIHL